MKRYLHLFPLMALTAVTFTLAACDENKTDDTVATEQTAPAETAAPSPEITATDNAAAPASAGVMHAEGATSYSTAADATTGVVFLTLHNPQTAADKLIGASTDVATSVEIHQTSADANGTMSMNKVDAIEIQPGQQVDLKPQSYHLMLIGLKAPLAAGTEFQLTLDFQNAPDVMLPVTVTLPVSAPAPEANTPPAPAPTTEPTPAPTPDEAMPTEGAAQDAAPSSTAPEEPAMDAAPADGAHSGH